MDKRALAAEDVCNWAHPQHLLFHMWALPHYIRFAAWAGSCPVAIGKRWQWCQLELYLRSSDGVTAMWKEWREPHDFIPCSVTPLLRDADSICYWKTSVKWKIPPCFCKWIYSTDSLCCFYKHHVRQWELKDGHSAVFNIMRSYLIIYLFLKI